MTTLYVDRRGASLDLDGETIVIRNAAKKGERLGHAPMRVLERVVIRSAAHIASRLIAKLSERGVGLVIQSGRSKTPSVTLLSREAGDAQARLAQYDLLLDEPARAEIARNLTAAKLDGQIATLRLISDAGSDGETVKTSIDRIQDALNGLRKAQNPFTRSQLLGIEGSAAAAFFSGFQCGFTPDLGFHGRNRRPPRDPVNVGLSLGYTLIQFEATRLISEEGLDPILGIYHDPRGGRDALALDIIEPVRPRVDQFVWRLFDGGKLKADGFSRTNQACRMNKTARKTFYRAYEQAAADFGTELKRWIRQIKTTMVDRFAGRPGARLLQDDA